MEEVVQTD